MRGSAAAVGVMMCYALGVPMNPTRKAAACDLGYGMQMTNFLRDVAEDATRGRVYIPVEDLERFGLSVDDVFEGQFDDRWQSLIRFEINRTRNLYASADAEIDKLPGQVRKAVKLARILYSRILNRIEDQKGNVFLGRVRTSKFEKMAVAARVVLLG
jgi:phytoene synthase